MRGEHKQARPVVSVVMVGSRLVIRGTSAVAFVPVLVIGIVMLAMMIIGIDRSCA